MRFYVKQSLSIALIFWGFLFIMEPQWDEEQNKIQQAELMIPLVLKQAEQKKQTDVKTDLPVVGKIEIKKIDLEMPIIKEATVKHLKVSACTVVSDRKMGVQNNFVIAGHRGRSYGRHFNRLSELVIGDSMTLTNETGESFTYVVDSVNIVDQSELSVLENNEQDEVTLITCEPTGIESPTKRRIVKAVRVLYNEK